MSQSAAEWDAARYDKLSAPQARWGQVVLDRLELTGGETVLDAGCGSGRVTEKLVHRLPRGRVIALDSSGPMLEEARARLAPAGQRARFLQVDLLELRPEHLGDWAPVDAVLSTATFHWVTDHDRLFANLRDVLRPGGQLVAQCGAQGNVENLVRAVRSLGAERAGTWLYATPEETARRLEKAGFVDLQVWSQPEPTPFAEGNGFVDFLETVCLREHLGTLAPEQRRPFTEAVAAAMPARVIDYVRLNIVARRGPDAWSG